MPLAQQVSLDFRYNRCFNTINSLQASWECDSELSYDDFCNGVCDCTGCEDEQDCTDDEIEDWFAADTATDGDEYFYCEDGDQISGSWVCDDDCDCHPDCEDELPCKNGTGTISIEFGGIEVNLNLKQQGGKFGVKTHDLLEGIYDCLFHWDCPWN